MIPDAVEAELAAILADLPPGLTHRQTAARVRELLEGAGWDIHPNRSCARQSAPDEPGAVVVPEPVPDAAQPPGTAFPPPSGPSPVTPKRRALPDDARAIAARYDHNWPKENPTC